jgi:hypothetical protein
MESTSCPTNIVMKPESLGSAADARLKRILYRAPLMNHALARQNHWLTAQIALLKLRVHFLNRVNCHSTSTVIPCFLLRRTYSPVLFSYWIEMVPWDLFLSPIWVVRGFILSRLLCLGDHVQFDILSNLFLARFINIKKAKPPR